MRVLIDTSFLVAVLNPKDERHLEARTARQNLRDKPVIAAPTLYELFYMIATRVSYQEALKAFSAIRAAPFQIEALIQADMERMEEIMQQYRDAEFDFTDASIMALSERLNITAVYTFDHRDFHIFRPKHCDYLRLLPG